MNFYIADMHLGHKNVLKVDNRPFLSVSEMDKVLIEKWNSRVSTNDDVYLLGDVCYRSEHIPAWYLKQLNGRKHLIQGNHDGVLMKDSEAMGCMDHVDKLLLYRLVENALCCATFLLQNGMVFIKALTISTVIFITGQMGCISTCVHWREH